jgi:type IV pilus assembly protein PilO
MLFWRKQQVVILVMAALLVAGFVFFACLPLCRKLKVVRQARATQRLMVARAATEERQLPLLKEQLAKMTSAVGNYEARVPANRDLGAFLQQIANLMSRQKLTEQVVAPGQEVKTDDLNCIPVSMQCKGKLAQLFEFYKELQKLERLVSIESVKLANDSDLTGHVTMQTKAVVYYRSSVEPGQGV